jgi:hypothetical protein
MITIHNLEVRFDVEGEGDDAVFARLFEKHIRAWSRREREARARLVQSEQDRAVGDRSAEPA